MLEIKSISKSFKTKKFLSNIDLTILDGTVLGLVGINGTDKSTLLRLISGKYKADFGTSGSSYENVYVRSAMSFSFLTNPFIH